MPDSWQRHLGLRDPSPRGQRRCHASVSGTRNRAILNLRRDLATKKLEAETIEAIWKWADDPAIFLAETNGRANAFIDGAALPIKPLDSVCILLSHLETQGQLDRIRQRLLLCFLALVVQEKLPAIGTQDDVATLLVQSHLISEDSREWVAKSLDEWLSKGRQYLFLAENLHGAGALIFLPLWGESTWYHHCHASGKDVDEIVALLEARGVTRDASEIRRDGRSAYDVADKLFQGLINRSGFFFVPYEATSSSPQQVPPRNPIRRYRQRRQPSRRGRSSIVPCSSPTVGQQTAQELLQQHLVGFRPSPSVDAAGSCTPEMINSPSATLSHEDDCRVFCVSTLPTV